MDKTYTESLSVRSIDCDLYGKMRLDALFAAMQEGGETHARLLGLSHQALLDRHLFFVLSRIHVSILNPPRFGQSVRHTTWPGTMNRFFCPRYHVFSLEDGTPLAAAGALWVVLDTETRRLISPIQADLRFPDNSDLPAPVELPNRLPARITSTYSVSQRLVQYSDMDLNGHVNNTRYITWLCDQLGKAAFEHRHISSLTAGYEREIRDEPELEIHLAQSESGFSYEVSSAGAVRHFLALGTFSEDA
ncbi:MAG: hypothetical protein IJ088_08145 [Clostridia bacterium]|nr:hypothetical protein [Clostridia bacterium]